jgi:ribosome biogenesis GTPase A
VHRKDTPADIALCIGLKTLSKNHYPIMSINWYPGHMHKARKEIIKTLTNIDILIEVVDARLPYSSQNPIIADLRHGKPTIIILNKCDLADPGITLQWQQYYESHSHIKTLACQQEKPGKTKEILDLCKQIAIEKDSSYKAVNAMIVGIPNVGKSTIINTLAGKIIAKVGNEPAVTKHQQQINLAHRIILHDTPGILWPKIENEHSGYRLAASGAIKNTAMEYEDVGFYTAEYLLDNYPELLKQRYQLKDTPGSPLELLELIGKRRGAKQARGRVNLHKVCEILLHEFRQGAIGAITLEQPIMIEKELIAVKEIQLAKLRSKEKKSRR